MRGVFQFLCRPDREPFVAGDQVEVLAVDEYLMLCGLEGEDVAHILVGDRIGVGLELDDSIQSADTQGHLGAVVWVERQGGKGRALLLHEELDNDTFGGVMEVLVGLLLKPPLRTGPEIFHVLEVASVKEIPLYELERFFHLPFCLRPCRPACQGFAAIVGYKLN